MRIPYSTQQRFDCEVVEGVRLNLNCRDEIIPILRALQHIYSQPQVRDEILGLVAQDVNNGSRTDRGRAGLDYWQILVLASVRLGCNLDYDKLQDLAEQHRALRQVMGIGDWDEDVNFSWRRIRDNVGLLQPETIEKISHLIVNEGHRLEPDAVKKVRVDSFVVETNIHYPTESSLIVDGTRKVIEICVLLSATFGTSGWRQADHLLKKVKQTARQINRISSRKGKDYKKRLKRQYRKLLGRTETILNRAKELGETLEHQASLDFAAVAQLAELKVFIERTEHVCGTARRRVINGEKVPNEDKLFSIFEPHTQLFKRGKAGKPLQFGRLVLVCEDAAGFISHHYVMPRDAQDQDVVVPQTRKLQDRCGGRIEEASFDRGFHSPENQEELSAIIHAPCLPKPGSKQSAAQLAEATVKFHEARRRHPGIESAIGALQSGNGLKRCRDATELGFERYVALGILGRNLHTLGKLLIAQEDASAKAAFSKCQAA
jgi:IS5 family transposase